MIPKDGDVIREGNITTVRIQGPGKDHLLNEQGVVCTNPEAPDEQRIYQKQFERKRVILPGDEGAFSILEGENVMVLGMTGYSSIKPADCLAWGVREGAYEAACEDLLRAAIEGLRREFPGISIRIAEGASDMGVDRAILNVCRTLDIPHLGFSCPNFMFYVKDDDSSVFVAPTQADYADEFIRQLHILIGANGRMQALEHDMVAAIKFNKRLILANVIKAISTNGGPPARGPDGKIIDATAAFQQCIVSLMPRGVHSSDPYADLRQELTMEAIRVARGYLGPSVAFGGTRRLESAN